jgi:small subunit ribosomal protein S5
MTDEQQTTQQKHDTPSGAPPAPVQPASSAEPKADQGNRGRGGRFGRPGPGGRGGRFGGRGRRPQRPREKPEFESKTLDLARVSRVTKGGKRFSFRATVVAGDQKGRVGLGIGKGQDVQQSIKKAYNQARKKMMNVIIVGGTIPYQVSAKFSSAEVILKPSKGGIKAGGAVRTVAQLAGISALTGKLVSRTNNKLNIARATIAALAKLRPVPGYEPPKPKEAKEGAKPDTKDGKNESK